VAIVLQGVWAATIALTGKYDQILNYVEAIDVLFFGLTGASLIVFRMRERRSAGRETPRDRIRVPGHPLTTMLFVFACWAVAITTVVQQPRSAGIGVLILIAGVFVFQFWSRRAAPADVVQ
jgi:APA family basic amino acid/polyamine antiporter